MLNLRNNGQSDVQVRNKYLLNFHPEIYVIFIEGEESYVDRFVTWTFSEDEARKICGKHPDLCYDIVPGHMETTDKKVYRVRRTYNHHINGWITEIITAASCPYDHLLKALDKDEPSYFLADSQEEAENIVKNREFAKK